MDILPSKTDTRGDNQDEALHGFTPLPMVKSQRAVRRALVITRKWVDAIENFAQYVLRRLQAQGIVANLTSSISYTANGYIVTLNVQVIAIDEKKFTPFKNNYVNEEEEVVENAKGDNYSDTRLGLQEDGGIG